VELEKLAAERELPRDILKRYITWRDGERPSSQRGTIARAPESVAGAAHPAGAQSSTRSKPRMAEQKPPVEPEHVNVRHTSELPLAEWPQEIRLVTPSDPTIQSSELYPRRIPFYAAPGIEGVM
jgi:hypothetical protein